MHGDSNAQLQLPRLGGRGDGRWWWSEHPAQVLDHLVPGGVRGDLDARMHSELRDDLLDMGARGRGAHVQRLGDEVGAGPGGQKPQDLALARAQLGDPPEDLLAFAPSIEQPLQQRAEHLALYGVVTLV